ncbi:hypothetical protein C2G38_2300217 [Gigaspora rosea]|uniref:Uncharacterized protein n=1 Tax=Gigaspora rosea TaxID=44941 RepID=A0A397VG31_9GLOM|nr:hypothetical protein C2G38_2300217 [Gigaspora rosea]
MDKYEDERKEEEEDLPNDRIRVAEIGSADEMNMVVPCCENGVEVEKDETKVYEVKVDKDKDEIDKKDNEDFKAVDKTAKMDYVEGTFESSLETGIDVVIEIPWNYRKPTGMDSERKLDKLEEVSLEENFVDDEPSDESDCDTLVEDDVEKNEGNNDNKFEVPLEGALSHACKEWMRKVSEFRKTAKEINEPTERKLTEGTVKVRDCSQGRIEIKMDETKEPSCCYKLVELGNMTGAFMSGISVCISDGTAFELDLKPIERGSLDNLKSVIENTFENNGTWFKNRFEESTVQIKESINKGIKTGKNNDAAVACSMDSNKEKKEGKGKKIVKNSEMPRKNQGFGYLPMNGPFTPIFDPGGVIEHIEHIERFRLL